MKVKSLSRVQLFATPWTVAYQVPPSMGFSRREYWSGLPFTSPADLPNPGIEPGPPALQADALQSEPAGKPFLYLGRCKIWAHRNRSSEAQPSCLGPVACVSLPEPPRGARRVRGVWGCWTAGLGFPPCGPSGLTVRAALISWLQGCHILCVLIGQAVFLDH